MIPRLVLQILTAKMILKVSMLFGDRCRYTSSDIAFRGKYDDEEMDEVASGEG